MKIRKRNGKNETVKFDKILSRVRKQTYGLSNLIDPFEIAKKVIDGVYDGVTTKALDILAAETAASKTVDHPDYAILASRIAITSLHKEAKRPFSEVIEDLHKYVSPETGEMAGLIDDKVHEIVTANADRLNEALIFDRDFNHDYFGFKTLERSYLLKMNGQISECPQHMWMRVAVGIWRDNIDEVIKTYDLLSQGYFTHATPTLFNSGTKRSQMSSCFLLGMDDSLEGIFETINECAMISKNAGGIGTWIHDIRASGAYIKGTNGRSNGIIPMSKVLESVARYIDQGGGRRKGSIAVYLEPWHADIEDFLNLRKNSGKEEMRARDLFTAMWVPDLFMERVKSDGDWTLFSPDEAPGLSDTYGDEFVELYERYEAEGKGRSTVKARYVWGKIIESQIETGTPYVLYKDSINKKSNQKNIGVIKSSNLCTEITEVSIPNKEVAVCNLASIALPKYIDKTKKGYEYNFEALYDVAYQATKNLNRVIDLNYYPIKPAKDSNLSHRPIGLGVQGLADVFALMHLPFGCDASRKLNKDIFETIYFAALKASCDLAEEEGAYSTFEGSPASKGELQFHMWGLSTSDLSGMYDWDSLIERIKDKGLRNSLLLAPMPTASTSQILGNNECFEPFTSNMFLRRTLSGEFAVVNKHLVKDLASKNLWTEEVKNQIILNNGSIQDIKEIPDDLKEVYRTVWEISQKDVIDMAADRGVFICQSQSMNLFIEDANAAKVTSALFYGWEKGLKTGMYYLRSKAPSAALKGLGVKTVIQPTNTGEDVACSLDNPEDCVACGA